MSHKRFIAAKATVERALAFGLSGVGMLVTSDTQIRALQRGDSVGLAWSNVGRYLERAAAKQSNDERRKQSSAG